MRRGLRYLPAPRTGRRRVGLVGLGVLAALTLVWQQQATLATFIDADYAKASFTAATLTAIDPVPVADVLKVKVDWTEPTDPWTAPIYALNWSATGSGTGTSLSTSATTPFLHDTSGAALSDTNLNFTDVAAGATHACGIARGTVYCWGTSASGALGGATSPAKLPTAVAGLSGKTVTDVSAGTDLTCAVADGAAYCWGLGTNGQLGNNTLVSSNTPVLVSGLSGKTVTAVSAGTTNACAVANGAAYCWGLNTYGQVGDTTTTRRLIATNVSTAGVLSGRIVGSITVGTSHACAVADSQAFCWGRGANGRLGNNSTNSINSSPVAVSTASLLLGRTVTEIAAGDSQTCAIADGKAYCWGGGGSGQLGNGTTTASQQTPVAVTATTMTASVTDLSAGFYNTCAIAGGKVYCWGSGTNNALGNNGTTASSTPVAVTASGVLNGRTPTVVSVGTYFGCTAGASPAACWGYGSSYQLGDNATTNNAVPADVSLTDKACPDGSVRTSSTTCSLLQGTDYYYKLDYSIGTWGAPASGWVKATTKTRGGVNPSAASTTPQSISMTWGAAPNAVNAIPEYTVQRSASSDGTNPTTIAVTGSRTFTDVGGFAQSRDFTQLSAGSAHTCGIVDTQLYCWGSNANGQLGIGSTVDSLEPALVAGLVGKTVTMVSAGANHTCAVADDKAYCWGLNNSGQLGDGTTVQKTSPQLIPNQDGYTVTAISAGTSHSCGIGSGVVYCWGLNGNGQLGNGTTNQQLIPTQVVNSTGFTNTGATRVSAGGSHTCAVAGTKAYCWGLNGNGQLGNGQTTPSPIAVSANAGDMLNKAVTEISAGTSHTCAIAASKAYCWGQSTNGQVGNYSTSGTISVPSAVYTGGVFTNPVTAISAGYQHTCAVAGAASYCWGNNNNGQLGNNSQVFSQFPVAVSTAGALGSASATDIAVGNTHSCTVAGGRVYCWGLGTNGRLGMGGLATNGNLLTAQATVSDARCAAGEASLGNGTCSLVAGKTYYYLVKFTLDGNTATPGVWTDLKTAG